MTEQVEGASTDVAAFETALQRAEAVGYLNVFTAMGAYNPDAPKGRLSGMILAVKANTHMKGIPSSAGTAALENFVPAEDAPLIARLRAEGAQFLGAANMHELAFGITSNNVHFGAVGNPYDPSRFAGGSSGGSAAAVGARIVPAAIAADTGGSVRLPAALCGAIGFRPSTGRYPMDGVAPISTSRDIAGPIALTMSHITLLDSVLANKPEVTQAANLAGLRLGVVRDTYYRNLHPETARLMDGAFAKLEAAGVVLVEFEMPGLFEAATEVGSVVAIFETVRELPIYLEKYGTGVDFFELAAGTKSPDVNGLFTELARDANDDGKPDGIIPQAAYDQAITVQIPQMRAQYSAALKANAVDAVVFATTILPAGPIEGSVETVELNGERVPTFDTYVQNLDTGAILGAPGISLPIGLTNEGLPVGMELDGVAGNDEALLALALAVEPLFGPLPAPMVAE